MGSGDGQFLLPTGVAVDALGGVVVADLNNNRMQTFTANGIFQYAWGSAGSLPGQFLSPVDVAITPGGKIFVADSDNDRVQRFYDSTVPVQSTTWGRVKTLFR